jgi:hypothetical protein
MHSRSTPTLVSLIACAAFVCAQGLTPKDKPSDYPSHEDFGNGLTLGAEYLVHTLPTANGALIANDYLVIEVAVFGAKGGSIDLDAGHFTLRLNQKTTLTPDSPGVVAASIKYPDWTQKPKVDVSGGAGNSSVIYGPPQAGRFPGDPTMRPPPAPPLPEDNPAGLEKQAPVPVDERIQRAALPQGNQRIPVAGVVCFPFRGKTKSIKSLELIYEGPTGRVSLKLN